MKTILLFLILCTTAFAQTTSTLIITRPQVDFKHATDVVTNIFRVITGTTLQLEAPASALTIDVVDDLIFNDENVLRFTWQLSDVPADNEVLTFNSTGSIASWEAVPGGHDAVTLSGTPDYITLSGQDIIRGLVVLTTDVSGVLPDANVANDITIDLATLATTLTITDNESTAETNAVIFTSGGALGGGNLGLESDGTFNYNPSTGSVTSTTFVGALTGNSTTTTTASNVSFEHSKSFVLISPVATDDYPLWRVPFAMTITRISILVEGGTNVVFGLFEADANGDSPVAIDSDITGTAGTNVNDDGSLTNPVVDATDYLNLQITSVSGSVTSMTVTFNFTYN